MLELFLKSQKMWADLFLNGLESGLKIGGATAERIKAVGYYWNGVSQYINDFMTPFWISLNSFQQKELKKFPRKSPEQNLSDYYELLQFNIQIASKGLESSLKGMREHHSTEIREATDAWFATFFGGEDKKDIVEYIKQNADHLRTITYDYPKAIIDIGTEFGFHFDDGGYIKTAETDRFELYQILPLDKGVKVRKDGKPVIIINPYVLGANILAFLPGERKSYVHAFANQGIPTYIRIMRDIDTTPAVQTLTGEDDAKDTRYFCELLKAKHQKMVTLHGYCQGGFVAVTALLSGELDGLVDAFITCVSPMDGARSEDLVEYLEHIPPRFRDLGYATKTLPNGNQVVDGKVMSWVYKLKSMEKEAPIFTFYRDLKMLQRINEKGVGISKTAAALNHWLIYDRTDLPVSITQMSFDSYTIPVSKDGTLPVKLFGRKLNFKRIAEKGIKWLICYGERDDLVDKESALAPMDYIDVEVTPFPKGHGAIATSWSNPESEFALHKRFGNNYRGPVRFQLDLEEELKRSDKSRAKTKKTAKGKPR